MPVARCAPDHADVPVAPGESLLDAMLAAGVPVAHACGGNARCSTCRVRIVGGAESCEPRPDDERAMAERLGFDDATRLACRTRIRADMALRRLVIDEFDVRLAGETVASKAPASSGREARVAVLFADIADFTPLAEALPAYDVIHLLNRWFHVAGEAVSRHRGYIDNYMGDGFMAVFGLEDEAAGPLQSVRGGLDVLRAAQDLANYTRDLFGREFVVRVGVHWGAAVVGSIGAAGRQRETLIGDTVNVAARIEAANKSAGTRMLVSAAVAERTGPSVVFGRQVDAELKGKLGAHRLHEVVGVTAP